MATLILPCAGKSSRYTDTIPKFLIKNPLHDNLSMVVCSILGLPLKKFDTIQVVIREEHDLEYNASEQIFKDFEKIGYSEKLNIIKILNSKSASDTVSQCISIDDTQGYIFIKDCDDYFTISDIQPNEIATISLNDCGKVNASNKSYIAKNDNDLVLNIVEKQVISSDFCCGLYSFRDAKKFVETYNALTTFGDESEIYISHIVFKMILQGETFKNRKAENFIDWGTQEDWDDYIRKGHAGIL